MGELVRNAISTCIFWSFIDIKILENCATRIVQLYYIGTALYKTSKSHGYAVLVLKYYTTRTIKIVSGYVYTVQNITVLLLIIAYSLRVPGSTRTRTTYSVWI